MADANHKSTTSEKGMKSESNRNDHSHGMQRFLNNRQDEHMMHQNTMSERDARSRNIQAVLDRVDGLGFGGRSSGRQGSR